MQPICLPLPDEKILPRTSCIVGGWGRIKESMSFSAVLSNRKRKQTGASNPLSCVLATGGRLPAVLRQVQLDLVDPAKCKHVLHTVKGSGPKHGAVRPEAAMTVLCAGPERGGRDACQVGHRPGFLAPKMFDLFQFFIVLPAGRLGGSSGMSGRVGRGSPGGAGRDFLGQGLWSELGKQQRPAPGQERVPGGFHRPQAAAALDQEQTASG